MSREINKRNSKSKGRAYCYILMIISFLGMFLVMPKNITRAVTSTPDNSATAIRLYGKDKYSTAISISKAGWVKSNYAVLASGENSMYTLSAVPLAEKYNCPIILTAKASLSNETINELKRLKVREVFVIGGISVISNQVDKQLSANKISFTRIAGANQYETSVKIAEKIGVNGEVAVVNSGDLSDAISISSIAASRNMAILLNGKDNLDKGVSKLLNSNKVYNTTIIGGTDYISENVSKQLAKWNPVRIGGKDKYEKNINILKHFSSDIDYKTVYIVSGNDSVENICAAALAQRTNSPIVMFSGDNIEKINELFKDKVIQKVVILAGENIISNTVRDTILNAANHAEAVSAKVVEVKNTRELLANIGPNTKILLNSGEYNLLDTMGSTNKYIKYNKVFDGFEMVVQDVSNLTIQEKPGSEVSLVVAPRYANVLSFEECNNITLVGLVAGHYPDLGECTGGVLNFTNCKEIKVQECDLYGCGTEGVTLNNVDGFDFIKSTIRECSYSLMTIIDSKNVNFKDSIFKDTIGFDLINISNSNVGFNGCSILNNNTNGGYYPELDQYLFVVDKLSNVTMSNSIIKGNDVDYLSNNTENIKFTNVNFEDNYFDEN